MFDLVKVRQLGKLEQLLRSTFFVTAKAMKRQKRFSRRLKDLLVGVRRGGSRLRRAGRHRPFWFEPLENRNLLAGDLIDGLDFTEPVAWQADAVAPLPDTVEVTSFQTSPAAVQKAEGEPKPDLVAFAKALTQAGVKYYGTAWCVHCNSQKALFEDGADYLPFVEVTNPDRTVNQAGIDNGITSFPTWKFPGDPAPLVGQQTLQTISDKAKVPIPTSESPFIKPTDDLTLLGGSPLMVPLDGYDPNGGPLTYTITSDKPSLVTPTLLQGNRSMEIQTTIWGKMVFQLFEDKAPRPTGRVIKLAQDGFYKNVIFHRDIDGFVVQGGDPTGTGTGGSTLGDFDDQFNVDLQHNRAGLLSFAKSGDDTNDSQFFITNYFNPIYYLRLTGKPTGGSFTLSYGGQTTAAINFPRHPYGLQCSRGEHPVRAGGPAQHRPR